MMFARPTVPKPLSPSKGSSEDCNELSNFVTLFDGIRQRRFCDGGDRLPLIAQHAAKALSFDTTHTPAHAAAPL
jgi:hypothetical protein